MKGVKAVSGPDSRAEQAGLSAPCAGCAAWRRVSRRTLLKSALGAGLYLQFARLVEVEAEEPQKARPQAGDFLVSLLGARQGQALTPHDVPMGGPPLIVYPMDPATQTIRNGSRLNRVLVVRLTLEGLVEQTRALAADGVLGYSAICPHTGCDVTGWQSDTQYIVCPCHASTFDPRDRARVVSGPAPRSLAALPLQLVDGKITVAGPFLGKVGAEQK